MPYFIRRRLRNARARYKADKYGKGEGTMVWARVAIYWSRDTAIDSMAITVAGDTTISHEV